LWAGVGASIIDDLILLIAATFALLSERGATFLSEPAERPCSVAATLRDKPGNRLSVTERALERATS
jgi:hypothetical protein